MYEVIIKLIEFQNQIRILHWQTHSFARHKAFGEFYDELGNLLDALVESYQGKYPRIKIDSSKIQLLDLNELELNDYISNTIKILTNDFPKKLEKNDTDILNIRDEILALIHKLKYLCTLK